MLRRRVCTTLVVVACRTISGSTSNALRGNDNIKLRSFCWYIRDDVALSMKMKIRSIRMIRDRSLMLLGNAALEATLSALKAEGTWYAQMNSLRLEGLQGSVKSWRLPHTHCVCASSTITEQLWVRRLFRIQVGGKYTFYHVIFYAKLKFENKIKCMHKWCKGIWRWRHELKISCQSLYHHRQGNRCCVWWNFGRTPSVLKARSGI